MLDAEIRFSESLLVQSIGKDHHFRSLAPITLSEPNGSVGKSHSSTNVNIQTIILQKNPKNVTYLTAHFILRGDEFILLSVCRKNGLSRVYDKFNEFPSSYLRFFRQTASYLFKATTDHYIIVDKGFTCSPSLPVFSRLDEEQINLSQVLSLEITDEIRSALAKQSLSCDLLAKNFVFVTTANLSFSVVCLFFFHCHVCFVPNIT